MHAGTILFCREKHHEGSTPTITERSTRPSSFLDLHWTFKYNPLFFLKKIQSSNVFHYLFARNIKNILKIKHTFGLWEGVNILYFTCCFCDLRINSKFCVLINEMLGGGWKWKCWVVKKKDETTAGLKFGKCFGPLCAYYIHPLHKNKKNSAPYGHEN